MWRWTMLAVLLCAPAWAQKNSGPLLPTEPYAPAPRPYIPPPQRVVPPPSYQPPAAPRDGGNPDVERQAQALPIDPRDRELRDQMPADPRGIERRLGLQERRGPATDLRGRTASAREIVDALRPR